MGHLIDLRPIATDAEYFDALDELEQLVDAPASDRSERACELTDLIAEYEVRVANVLSHAVKARPAG